MNDTLEKFKKDHDEDIMSLLKKPPLDSMDVIKCKFLDLAKKNKIVLNTENLNEMMDKYRQDLVKVCRILKKIRIDGLNSKIVEFKLNNYSDVIKFTKKDFIDINKEIKKTIKDYVKKYCEDNILNKIDCVFLDDTDKEKKEKIIADITKFVNGIYQRQLLENVDFKVLVKDTILINGTKEQNERYLFTLNNSRIFNDL